MNFNNYMVINIFNYSEYYGKYSFYLINYNNLLFIIWINNNKGLRYIN